MDAATNHTLAALDRQALGIRSDPQSLSAYFGTCPTCAANPLTFADEYSASVPSALCPTCGHASVEYGMIIEMDAILARLNSLDALGATLDEQD